jgi:hypothetical protein
MRSVLLSFMIVSFVSAADPVALARVMDGSFIRDGQPLTPGTEIFAGQPLVVTGQVPARLEFIAPTQGMLILLPESQLTLTREQPDEKAGEKAPTDFIVDLQRGRVETQLDALGDFASLHVRGAALSVRVTGTIFVVDRTRRDSDYVAMVLGKVSVTLRREIAALLQRTNPPVEITAGQGLGGNTQTGVGEVQTLSAPASVTAFPKAVANLGLVPEAGFAPGAGTGGVLDTGGGSQITVTEPAPAPAEPAPVLVEKSVEIPPVVVDPIAFEPVLPQQIIEEINNAVTEQITTQIVEEVTQQIIGSAPTELPTPPALPQ